MANDKLYYFVDEDSDEYVVTSEKRSDYYSVDFLTFLKWSQSKYSSVGDYWLFQDLSIADTVDSDAAETLLLWLDAISLNELLEESTDEELLQYHGFTDDVPDDVALQIILKNRDEVED